MGTAEVALRSKTWFKFATPRDSLSDDSDEKKEQDKKKGRQEEKEREREEKKKEKKLEKEEKDEERREKEKEKERIKEEKREQKEFRGQVTDKQILKRTKTHDGSHRNERPREGAKNPEPGLSPDRQRHRRSHDLGKVSSNNSHEQRKSTERKKDRQSSSKAKDVPFTVYCPNLGVFLTHCSELDRSRFLNYPHHNHLAMANTIRCLFT